MGISELETVVRLGRPMLIVVYNDAAYGAEVHHFGSDGYPLECVTFPHGDLAAMARGFGCEAITVRTREDLDPVRAWLSRIRPGQQGPSMLIDAKIVSKRGAWWLEEAFGH